MCVPIPFLGGLGSNNHPSQPSNAGPANPALQDQGGANTGGMGGHDVPTPSPGDFMPKDSPAQPKQPDPPAAAAPAPVAAPNPSMEDPDPQETAAQRLKRLGLLRMGLANTIVTSPQGVTQSPLLSVPSLYSPGTKDKLGQ